MKTILIAAALCLSALPAFAQYNSSGQQAGGPLAGAQRRMGAPGGAPASFGHGVRHHRRVMHHRRHHRM
jgi:hypothetical protein